MKMFTFAFCLSVIALSFGLLVVIMPSAIGQPSVWIAAVVAFALLLWSLRTDPPIFCQRQALMSRRETLQTLLPPGATLYLVDCPGAPLGSQCFDVYLCPTPSKKLVYLNPLLAPLFPTCELDGATRVLVPFSGETLHGGVLLVRALAVRVWGERAEAGYRFELAY